ncbi:hypothetical protein Tco_0626125 [Tanacetum coccineum]|uniref:Uncharacterized protein n=1 Tax=Tanacetum coccineum TaxID=301880 RepID=A0ABQ4WIZ1_9ASTR
MITRPQVDLELILDLVVESNSTSIPGKGITVLYRQQYFNSCSFNWVSIIPSSRMEPVDKVPVLLAQHQVSDRSEIPLGGLVEYPASPREIPQESLELLALLQVASPFNYLRPPLW